MDKFRLLSYLWPCVYFACAQRLRPDCAFTQARLSLADRMFIEIKIWASTQEFRSYSICSVPTNDVSSKARCLNLGPNLHLRPYFVFASNERSGESADIHRLA